MKVLDNEQDVIATVYTACKNKIVLLTQTFM